MDPRILAEIDSWLKDNGTAVQEIVNVTGTVLHPTKQTAGDSDRASVIH